MTPARAEDKAELEELSQVAGLAWLDVCNKLDAMGHRGMADAMRDDVKILANFVGLIKADLITA